MKFQSSKPMPYVYICTDKITGQFYIGSRTTTALKQPSHEDLPKYRTSSKLVKPRFEEFDWAIVAEFFQGNDALSFEQEMIYENWNNPLPLNQTCHINHTSHWSRTGTTHTPEAKRKLSEYAKSRKWSDEHKQKKSDSSKGISRPCKREHKFYWFNDGKQNKLVSELDNAPANFVKGRLMPLNHRNTNTKGKTWFHDGTKRIYSSN